MAISDTDILDWSETTGNSPTDTEPVGSDLAAQIRNIKSVYRTLSANKIYEDHGFVRGSDFSQVEYTSTSILYQFAGANVVDIFQEGRKVVARNSGTGALLGGVVTYSRWAGNQTTLFVSYAPGLWSDSYDQLLLGTCNSSPRAFPVDSIGGTCAASGTSTSILVRFANYSATLSENTALINAGPQIANNSTGVTIGTTCLARTTNYFVHIHPCYFSGVEHTSGVVVNVAKNFYDFTVTLAAAPGDGEVVVFDWFITMPEYNF